jgi:hypothetical protein
MYASRGAHLPVGTVGAAAGEGPGPAQAAEASLPGSESAVTSHGPETAANTVDPEVEELLRYFERPARFWKAVLLVPVLGLLALAAEPNGGGLDQVWVLAALLVWLFAALVAAAVVAPGLRQMSSMLLGPAPAADVPGAQAARRLRLARAGILASRGAALCDVLFFGALALMIWRP